MPPASKTPPPTGYTGADGRWPSMADVFDWKLNKPRDCNVGLRLPSMAVGLDIDQYGDKHGWDNLLDAAREHDLSLLPRTWRTSARPTASGIYLYRVPEGTDLRGAAVPDVETIQHHHRFCVVWPSVHPNGDQYRWWEGGTTAPLPRAIEHMVPRVDQLPDLPADWLEFLSVTTPKALAADLPAPLEHRETVWASVVLDEYHKARAALLTASPGSRHELARDRCMALCRMEQNGLSGATAALDELGAIFVEAVRLERPSPAEAGAEWARMLTGGRLLARSTVTAAQLALDAERGDNEALLPPGAPAGATEAQSAPSWASALIDWPTFWQREQSEDVYLIEPLIVRGRGHALFASAKVGKSLLMLDVAACRSSGRPTLDEPEREPMSVVYLDMEMTGDDVHDRLTDMGYSAESDLSNLHYFLLPTLPPLDTERGGAVIEEIACDLKAELVVIDTMARVVDGEENNADTYRAFYRHAGTRLKRRGVAYSRLDHAGKDPTKGQRGSSAKADDVDIVWQIRPTQSGFVVKPTHSRVSNVGEFTVRRLSSPLRHVISGGDYPKGTKEYADRYKAVGVPIGATRTEASRLLQEAGLGTNKNLHGAAQRWRKQEIESPNSLVGLDSDPLDERI